MSTIAKTIAEARSAQGEYRAGGTDLSDRRRHRISGGEIVDISGLPGIDQISVQGDGSMRIGALATIHQVAEHAGVHKWYPGLAQAAGALANPQVRRVATLAGGLLQRNRCWYYRHEEISCFKKGGNSCPMREGNHLYGVCFDLGPCVSPHPSTLGMVLLAYDAQVAVEGAGLRNIGALYGDGKAADRDHLLAPGELVTHVHLPKPYAQEHAGYRRAISRARAEWPLVEVFVRANAAAGAPPTDVRVAIGGVANVPLLLPRVAAFLEGRMPSAEAFAEAGRIAALGATPLAGTQYKVDLIPGIVITTLEQAFEAFDHD